MTIKAQIYLTTLLLSVVILFFSLSNMDFWIQDAFFNQQTHQWIVDRELQPYKFIFYDSIKRLLILFAVAILISLIFFRKREKIIAYKKGLIIVLLSAIFVPLSVGFLKKESHMPCPKNEIHYGGVYPKTALWESYPSSFKASQNIRCWPAGHASGGFALLSLFFLFKSRKNRILSIAFALSIGWSTGLYKMLIGDHFFSHTLITMLLAWLIILLLASWVNKGSTEQN